MKNNYNSSDLTDCIYYIAHYEDLPDRKCCNYRKSLHKLNEDMCTLCRLWDSYIPSNASDEEKEKATKWQDIPYGEQPDYDDYF